VEVIAAQNASQPVGACGPEAKDWFVLQVNTAMKDPAVSAVKSTMTAADALARTFGTTAQEVAKGGAAAVTLLEERQLKGAGKTPVGSRPTAELSTGVAAGASAASNIATGAAARVMADPFSARDVARDAAAIPLLVQNAANGWKVLVNHGARYDFKAHTMLNPSTRCCPENACGGTITLCAGAGPENCYLTDLPGNLFYALIGKFVGFSELTLQLGSQFAQLTSPSGPSWDPPEDTAAIRVGFALPLPLTSTALCRAVAAAHGGLTAKAKCSDCAQLTTAAVK
jgi:Bacterial toxin 44